VKGLSWAVGEVGQVKGAFNWDTRNVEICGRPDVVYDFTVEFGV
jgi:hypothetical protein